MQDTIALVERLQATGISRIAIHFRQITQRSNEAAHLNWIEQIRPHVRVPLIVSGDVMSLQVAQTLLSHYHVDAVLFARAAMWNVSVFNSNPLHPIAAAQQMLQCMQQYDTHFPSAKYIYLRMFEQHARSSLYQNLARTKTMPQLVQLFENADALSIRFGNA